MNEKHQNVMNELLYQMKESYKDILPELAEYAVVLGYRPVWNKMQDLMKTHFEYYTKEA